MLLVQQTQTEDQLGPKQMKEESMSKIVIVDDDIELLEELNDILSFNKYEVETISDSSLVFKKVCELMPDLVILDLRMKTKNGFQLADELHHFFKTKSIPLIAITGFFTQKEHELMMKMCGIKSVLLKPIDPQNLLVTIVSVLKEAKSNVTQGPMIIKEGRDEFS